MMDLRFVSLSFQAVMMLRGLRMIGHQHDIPGIDSNVSRLNNSVFELVAQHQAFCALSSAKEIANAEYAQTKIQLERRDFLEQLCERLTLLYKESFVVNSPRGQKTVSIQKDKILAFLLDPQWVASIQDGYKFTTDSRAMTLWSKVARRTPLDQVLSSEVQRVIPSCQEVGEWRSYYKLLDLKDVLPKPSKMVPAIKKATKTAKAKVLEGKAFALTNADLLITVGLSRELITRHPAFIEARATYLAKSAGAAAWEKVEAALFEPVNVPYSKANAIEEVVQEKIEWVQKETSKFVKAQKDEQKADLLRALRPHVAQLRELKKDPKAWQEFIQEI